MVKAGSLRMDLLIRVPLCLFYTNHTIISLFVIPVLVSNRKARIERYLQSQSKYRTLLDFISLRLLQLIYSYLIQQHFLAIGFYQIFPK